MTWPLLAVLLLLDGGSAAQPKPAPRELSAARPHAIIMFDVGGIGLAKDAVERLPHLLNERFAPWADLPPRDYARHGEYVVEVRIRPMRIRDREWAIVQWKVSVKDFDDRLQLVWVSPEEVVRGAGGTLAPAVLALVSERAEDVGEGMVEHWRRWTGRDRERLEKAS